ncbi:DUF4446 family protein [Candidatus Parcubacteria bacterium]|nr:MAG: DUF4446 family protein [Candidatus Parcubacteria bacterium]
MLEPQMRLFIMGTLLFSYLWYILGALAIAVVVLIIITSKLHKRLKIFLTGPSGENLEAMLKEYAKDIKRLKFKSEDLEKRLGEVADTASKASQKIGIVRYNPFRETGGNQSFSLAVLDNSDNGFVLSALFTSERSRVYIKNVKGGHSPQPLTEEEKEAVKEAQKIKTPKL